MTATCRREHPGFDARRNGSPIPMKTAPVTRRPCALARSRAWTSWSRISQVARLRRRGIRAVAQKTQPIAQPTCDDRQTLTAPGLCSGIKTVSTARPSAVRKRSFWKPSTREVPHARGPAGAAGRGSRPSAGAGPGNADPSRRGSWMPRPIAAESRRRTDRSWAPRPGRGPGKPGCHVPRIEHRRVPRRPGIAVDEPLDFHKVFWRRCRPASRDRLSGQDDVRVLARTCRTGRCVIDAMDENR